MTDLRDRIARALLMVSQDDSVTADYAWGVQFEEVQDELLAQADAVLAVLADPPADVIEQAARGVVYEWLRTTGTAATFDEVKAGQMPLARREARAVFEAAFGGEQA